MHNTPRSLDETFSAFADPTRRAILQRLIDGEKTVGDLAEPFDMSLPAVSKHIKILEAAGLLNRRHEGRLHHLSLNPAAMRGAAEWIDLYKSFWTTKLDQLEMMFEQDTAGTETSASTREESQP